MSANVNVPMCGIATTIGAPNEEKPAHVCAIGDELLVRIPETVKKPNVTAFLVNALYRLRTVISAGRVRYQTRTTLFELLTSVNLDNAQKPYDRAVAKRVEGLLVMAGVGQALVVDFEMILKGFEDQAQERKARAESLAEALEAERRKKEEWEVLEQSDTIEEDWEIV